MENVSRKASAGCEPGGSGHTVRNHGGAKIKAVDTNILVYAHREEAPHHAASLKLLKKLAEGAEPWALPWICIYEFMRVVTHARIFHPPTPTAIAWQACQALISSPSVRLLQETERHERVAADLFRSAKVEGNLIHDAHIVALMLEHGVREIITADQDFHRFKQITVVSPF
jgi:toxin-antitoxin system PIN domain toxin